MHPRRAAEPSRRVRRSPSVHSVEKGIVGMELRRRALQVLCMSEPREKAGAARELAEAAATLSIAEAPPVPSEPLPGRPDRPQLVHPARVPRRSPAKPEG